MEEMILGWDLDPAIWGKLHPELVEKVLFKLPFLDLVKIRSLSRRWKDSVQCCLLAPQNPDPKSVLLYHHCGGIRGSQGIWMGALLAFFNSKTNTWERRCLSFLGTRSLVACDEGLLCFSSKAEPEKFFVCNPLTKQWRELMLPFSVLPPLPRGAFFKDPFNYMLTGMIMNKETGQYKLVVCGFHEGCASQTLIYDSAKCVWNVSTPLPRFNRVLEHGEWICSSKSINCNGNLYWFVYERSDGLDRVVKGLVRFNLEKEEWKFVQETDPDPYLCSFQLAAIGNNVVILDWDHDRFWSDMSLEPSPLLELGAEIKLMDDKIVELSYIDKEITPAWSLGQRDFVYLVFDCCPAKGLKLLVYDQSNGSVTWLPTWKHLRDFRSFWVFTPSIRAFA